MTKAPLSGSNYVTIQTNEGQMKRTNITKKIESESVIVEFDEEYQAGKMVTKTHYLNEFTISNNKVNHRAVLSGVDASGFLGFLYKKLGKSNIGNAVMNSYKTYFEMKKLKSIFHIIISK